MANLWSKDMKNRSGIKTTTKKRVEYQSMHYRPWVMIIGKY